MIGSPLLSRIRRGIIRRTEKAGQSVVSEAARRAWSIVPAHKGDSRHREAEKGGNL